MASIRSDWPTKRIRWTPVWCI